MLDYSRDSDGCNDSLKGWSERKNVKFIAAVVYALIAEVVYPFVDRTKNTPTANSCGGAARKAGIRLLTIATWIEKKR